MLVALVRIVTVSAILLLGAAMNATEVHSDKSHYSKRNVVQRHINRREQFRHVATRYEKRVANFSAMITITVVFFFSDFTYRLQAGAQVFPLCLFCDIISGAFR